MTPEESKAQIRACLKRRKARLKRLGLCQDCGKCARARGRTLCVDCLEDRRMRSKVRHRKESEENVERMMALAGK